MKFRNIFLVAVLMAFSGWVGVWVGQERLKLSFANWKPTVLINRQPAFSSNPTDADFSMFWRVWDTVSKLYVDKSDLNAEKMIDGAISGMVSAIGDPYTVYLPPQQNKEAKEDLGGAFEGVGIQLGYVDKQLAVVAALEGTPAFRAGVKSGDLILRIQDERQKTDRQTDGISLAEAVKLIRGTKGSTVKLTMYRKGQDKPFDLNLVRDTIVVKSVTSEYIPVDENKPEGEQVAWVKLTRFGDRTKDEWMAIVADISDKCAKKGKNCKGMILDLRNNPGGYLDMAVYTAGEFLKPGQLVVSQQYGDGTKEDNKVDRNGRLLDTPVVVLVNEGSASASEILAGALQDSKRAKVVGVKSFGKGSVQKPEDFANGSGIHVTIAKWLRPSGDWIDKKGITPDVIVEAGEATDSAKRSDDKQLMKAVEMIL
jgi:carboxyl-terminal processing protease